MQSLHFAAGGSEDSNLDQATQMGATRLQGGLSGFLSRYTQDSAECFRVPEKGTVMAEVRNRSFHGSMRVFAERPVERSRA
jgi:hypothetical protein